MIGPEVSTLEPVSRSHMTFQPLGKHVQTTHYVDANLHHDLATGKAVTAALDFLNQTPIDAYTKRQSTVEAATYGSEFVAARTAVDQIIDIRTTLQYLEFPSETRVTCLATTDQLLPALPSPTPPSPKDTISILSSSQGSNCS